MHGLNPHDGGRSIDWGKTSNDYSQHRPGPPLSFYARLAALGVGTPGQKLLDLGTGTGLLARQFARQGAVVHGTDISEKQIELARQSASAEGLSAEFSVHSSESLPWQQPTFDVVTANQCWLYFDKQKVIKELRRILKPGGLLVTSHFSWLPRLDDIARRTEELVLKFNPDWSASDWSGEIPPCPQWAEKDFDLRGMFYYDEPIEFTRDGWCGRIRACRGIGATLGPEDVARFDEAHREQLTAMAGETFTVLHRLDAHLFAFQSEN